MISIPGRTNGYAAAIASIAAFTTISAAAGGSPRAGADRTTTGAAPWSEATQRKVHGIITSVDAASMTLTPTGAAITGHVDARTRVFLDGHAAKAGDLHVAEHADGALALDETWLEIHASSK